MDDFIQFLKRKYKDSEENLFDSNLKNLEQFLLKTAKDYKNHLEFKNTNPDLKEWTVIIRHDDDNIKPIYESTKKVRFISLDLLNKNKVRLSVLALTRLDVLVFIRDNIDNVDTITIT